VTNSAQIVLLFPGQGSQYPGMAANYLRNYQIARETLEEASDVLGEDMQDLCMSDPHNRLDRTIYTQPAVLAISTALYRVLGTELGIEAMVVAGHSLGEYSALVALGGLTFADALRTVRVRAHAMQAAVPEGTGGMLAYVGGHAAHIQNYCERVSRADCRIEVASFNAPRQLTLSGHVEALERASRHIREYRLGGAVHLSVSAAFHSSLMVTAAQRLAEHLSAVPFAPLSGYIVANVDATAYSGDAYTRDLLIRQAMAPVRWLQSLHEVEWMAPDAVWVEVGPGSVLGGLVRRAFPKQRCIPMDQKRALENLAKQIAVQQNAA
jgi:[acyl-carrier-protein] S-malonyltransferase